MCIMISCNDPNISHWLVIGIWYIHISCIYIYILTISRDIHHVNPSCLVLITIYTIGTTGIILNYSISPNHLQHTYHDHPCLPLKSRHCWKVQGAVAQPLTCAPCGGKAVDPSVISWRFCRDFIGLFPGNHRILWWFIGD